LYSADPRQKHFRQFGQTRLLSEMRQEHHDAERVLYGASHWTQFT
jgi:hypothetical protein